MITARWADACAQLGRALAIASALILAPGTCLLAAEAGALRLEVQPTGTGKPLRFEITVTNLVDQELTIPSLSIESAAAEAIIRADIGCPCLAKCKRPVRKLDSGASAFFEWDGRNDRCESVDPGSYFAVSYGAWVPGSDSHELLGRSGLIVVR